MIQALMAIVLTIMAVILIKNLKEATKGLFTKEDKE